MPMEDWSAARRARGFPGQFVASHFGGCSPTSLPRLPPSCLLASRLLRRSTFNTDSTPLHHLVLPMHHLVSPRPFLPLCRSLVSPAPVCLWPISVLFTRAALLSGSGGGGGAAFSISFFGHYCTYFRRRYILYVSINAYSLFLRTESGWNTHLVNGLVDEGELRPMERTNTQWSICSARKAQFGRSLPSRRNSFRFHRSMASFRERRSKICFPP
ncbi:hypothetical protein K438DRAFT_570301 [Mycena galopus ATCC 62051]|nr:hypothetical protein K438DRAFT_570301 [Mycena galopus ATCC 62051]